MYGSFTPTNELFISLLVKSLLEPGQYTIISKTTLAYIAAYSVTMHSNCIYNAGFITHKSVAYCNTVQSHNYNPPFGMLALGKTGEGAYVRDSDMYT